MKICHVCGCEVEDRELVCPDCGATVVKHSGSLSIKAQEETKKKLNPMGMTVSTGSGLTDILRNESEFDNADVDDDYFGGSIPLGMAKTVIEDDGRKKSDTGKVIGKVIKILCIIALLYGAYWVVVNVFLNRDVIESHEEAIDIYVEAINDADVEKMEKVMPSYLNDPSLPAANIKGAVAVQVRFYGTTFNASGQSVEKNGEVELVFIKIKDNWLLETESYKAPDIK